MREHMPGQVRVPPQRHPTYLASRAIVLALQLQVVFPSVPTVLGRPLDPPVKTGSTPGAASAGATGTPTSTLPVNTSTKENRRKDSRAERV
jgi:hypothetical protein